MNSFWGYAFVGFLLACEGLYSIVTGRVLHHRNMPIPVWAGWSFFPIGCWFVFLSVRAMLRGQGKDMSESSPEDLNKALQRDEAARTAEAAEVASWIAKATPIQRIWKEYAETSKSKITFAQYMKNTKVRIGLGLMNAGLLAFLGLLLGFESSVLTFSAIALPIAGMLVLAVGTVEVI